MVELRFRNVEELISVKGKVRMKVHLTLRPILSKLVSL
jgi:hypothetical protein